MSDPNPSEVVKPIISTDDSDDCVYENIPKSYKFSVKDVKGTKKPYVMNEMTGLELTQWTAISAGRAKFSRNGVPLTKEMDYSNLYSALLALVIKERDTGLRVSKEVIDTWASSIQTDLFARCEVMNGLTEESREKAKNA